MKRLIVALALVVAAANAAYAMDGGRPYAGISAGGFAGNRSSITDPGREIGKVAYDPGFVVAGSGGYAFTNGIRLEGELSYRRADVDVTGLGQSKVRGSIWALSFLANAFFDIKTGTWVTPYFGGGIGFSTVNMDRSWAMWDDEDVVFAWQGGAGVGFDLTPNLALDVGYRYFGTEDVHFDPTKSEFSSHNGMIGIRYKF